MRMRISRMGNKEGRRVNNGKDKRDQQEVETKESKKKKNSVKL